MSKTDHQNNLQNMDKICANKPKIFDFFLDLEIYYNEVIKEKKLEKKLAFFDQK